MARNCAIVLAAGKGKRMGMNVNKQFLNLKEKPILYYSLKVFEESDFIDDIILVASEEEISYCQEKIVEKYQLCKVKSIVKGGKERQDSVFNGLRAINNCDVVLIHDGARPFIDERIIEDGINYARVYGACACGVIPKDTIKIRDAEGFSKETPDRNTMFCVQTPQCFKYNIILDAHKRLQEEDIIVTDDTMLVERYGTKVYLYDGSYNNIKITTPEDMLIGEKLADKITF